MRFLTIQNYYQFPENIYELLAQVEGLESCVFYGRWEDRFDNYELLRSRTRQIPLLSILIANSQMPIPKILHSELGHIITPYIELSLYYPNLVCSYYSLNLGDTNLHQPQLIASIQQLLRLLNVPDEEIASAVQRLNKEAGDILVKSEWNKYLELFSKIYDEHFWNMIVMGWENNYVNTVLIVDYANAFGCLVDEKNCSLIFPNSHCELICPTPFHTSKFLTFTKLQEVEAVSRQWHRGAYSRLQRYVIVAAKEALKISGYSNIKFHETFGLSPQAIRKYRRMFRTIMD